MHGASTLPARDFLRRILIRIVDLVRRVERYEVRGRPTIAIDQEVARDPVEQRIEPAVRHTPTTDVNERSDGGVLREIRCFFRSATARAEHAPQTIERLRIG